jgi:hypothetical protein
MQMILEPVAGFVRTEQGLLIGGEEVAAGEALELWLQTKTVWFDLP